MLLKRTDEDAYFAASNSERGFCSYYGECFDAPEVQRLYAVKGGPGTGKSRFLREVAKSGTRAGLQCEYVYCSSDPDSLDGIVLSKGREERIALLDATAPHVYEPRHPGMREEIVNLGTFWNADRLFEQRETIGELQKRKQEAYSRAYRYLAGAGEMEAVRNALVLTLINRDGIRRYAEHLMNGIVSGERYRESVALIKSVGMKGSVMLDTYFRNAHTLLRIEDCRGIGHVLLAELLRIAKEKKRSVRVSYDPVFPSVLDGIFLTEERIAFVLCGEAECPYPHKQLRVRRFLDAVGMREVREEVNAAERLKKAMIEGAISSLGEVREAHFALEEIYSETMSFPAKEKFTKEFCQKLFHLQNE